MHFDADYFLTQHRAYIAFIDRTRDPVPASTDMLSRFSNPADVEALLRPAWPDALGI